MVKASIHITDEQSETLDLAKYILNSNSIHFLNNSKPYLFQNTFHNLKLLKEKLNSLNINNDEIIMMEEFYQFMVLEIQMI